MEEKIKEKSEMMTKILDVKWKFMGTHCEAMNVYLRKGEFLDGYSGEQIFTLMMESLTIIAGEIINPLSRYKKYQPKDHTISEYVDMVIDTISNEMPSINDEEKILQWIEEFRVDMWGYINYHSNRFVKMDAKKSDKIGDKDIFISALRECAVVVMLECNFRKVERSFIKKVKTLKDVMPEELTNRDCDKTRAYKMKDVRVVEEHCSMIDQEEFKFWPGTHKNVYFWVVLENGNAVGWNENPSRGWSFPVIKMKE
jgi:hypothetical protein